MIGLISTAYSLQEVFEQQKWDFCFVGGIALASWGEARLTTGVDVHLLVEGGAEETFVDSLLTVFTPRNIDTKQFALKYGVLFLKNAMNIEVDISLSTFPYVHSMIRRSSYQDYLPEMRLRICSAEDLIITAAFANRPRDWNDLNSILLKQTSIDWNYVDEHLTQLVELKPKSEILSKLVNLRRES